MEPIGKSIEIPTPAYETGGKIQALDEKKRQMVEWTVVNYEEANEILHLKRDLQNGDVRMREVHIDRMKEEQESAQARQ